MAGAARKKKLTKYEVTIKREVEYTAVVEVEARSTEEAEDMAVNLADNINQKPPLWREGDVTSQSARIKVLRG